MKVLHIVGDSAWGGGGTIILALAEMARREGWTVDILATNPVCQQNALRGGLGVVPLDVIWRNIRPVRDLKGLFSLARFLRASDYSLVHTHTSKAGFVGRVAARVARVPAIVHTVHGFPFHEQSGVVARTAYVTLERLAATCCDRIVTVSKYHREWALKLRIGRKEQLVAIPNGIANSHARQGNTVEAVRTELGLSPDCVMVLAAGRLSTQKGFEYLLDAVPLLAKQTSRAFRIIIAGDGPLTSELEGRRGLLNCPDLVTLLGFREDVPDLLRACDVFALPSLYEGLSISLLEAMAAGKPIVATSVGGNLEPLQNVPAALIVPPKDPAALATALARFVNDASVCRAAAEQARSAFLQDYTMDRMIDGYRRIYRELASKKKVQLPDVLPSVASAENRE